MNKADVRNRLVTKLPKIGIRPTIDGRYGGVRESLENFTMELAHAAATLIESHIRHACGISVKCVIPDFTIGGFAEVAQCENLFQAEGVGVSLTVTPCWCYGSETMDMHPTRPKAIWGFNGTDRPGAVYLAATLSGHGQKGLPCFGIYGRDVQDLGDATIPTDVAEKILRFARTALVVAELRDTAYLAIGGTSMGIAGSIVDQDFFQRFLGMRVESVDMSEMVGRINKGQYDHDELKRALDWVQKNCPEGADLNPSPRSRSQKDDDWRTSILMTLITRDLMIGNPKLAEMGLVEQSRGHNAIAGGFQGQRHWTDHFPNGDFMEAVLCSSFDWNGIRQPFVFATENDSLNAASMLFGHLLTGTAQLFADVRTYWSPRAVERVCPGSIDRIPDIAQSGFLHLINSGPAALDWTGEQLLNHEPTIKRWYDVTEKDVDACLRAVKWCASDLGYFPSGGWSTDFTTQGNMPCTMLRLNLTHGLGPSLQIAEGMTVELPADVHDVLDQRTNPTWPSTWFVPNLTGHGAFADVYAVMNAWGANHGAICYGHIGADLITLASQLRIPVEMHNVKSSAIFRPATWNRFGSADEVSADYGACQHFGSLY